jgi:hypothetical protein
VGIYGHTLYIPAGTCTGDEDANYVGSLTLTNSFEVGDGNKASSPGAGREVTISPSSDGLESDTETGRSH